jgi:hypothetical protein
MNIFITILLSLAGLVGFMILISLVDLVLSYLWRKISASRHPTMPRGMDECQVRHAFRLIDHTRLDPVKSRFHA